MRKILMIAAALATMSIAAAPANAQKIDKNGRCHAKDGKFAKAEVCAGVKGSAAPASTAAAPATPAKTAPAPTKAATVDPKAPYKLDAKGKCHDAKGKMAAKAKCSA